jgi:hypothetical protein
MNGKHLVTAATLLGECGITRGSAYRMAKHAAIPAYVTGPKRTGVRFQVDEVLAALRRPATGEKIVK